MPPSQSQLKRDSSVAKTESISSVNQLAVDAYLQVDMRFSADLIEGVCGELLADPPKGVYHISKLHPVMVDGRSYFYRQGIETLLVEDINKVTTAVFDADGNCVIPSRYMRDKARFLANTPLLPYRGLLIVKAIVDHQINTFAAYHRVTGKTLADYVRPHFKAGVELEEDLLNNLDNCCASVRKELMVFLGDDVWNMFFTKQLTTALRIERSMDWRAWEWEQKHGDDFRAGKYA